FCLFCVFLFLLFFFFFFFFFFSSRRRHTRFDCDWSSDVCSSDLPSPTRVGGVEPAVDALAGLSSRRGQPHERTTKLATLRSAARSEERRVGKECRSRGWREE